MSSAWPPANFTDWPSTRIAALIFNAVVLVLLFIPTTRRVIFLNPWTCCCSDANTPRDEDTQGRPNGCLILTKALVVGCIIGLFLHFIPCIWWTCDWGEYDGQGVRGAIWFTTWAVVALAILCWGCQWRRDYKE